ncbi:hypothetical protein, partial [Escherichia coli]|uniref:hypothetical protein n=1 Tax=Escherichia coli TaxID=562 RepID=UPI001BB48217
MTTAFIFGQNVHFRFELGVRLDRASIHISEPTRQEASSDAEFGEKKKKKGRGGRAGKRKREKGRKGDAINSVRKDRGEGGEREERRR